MDKNFFKPQFFSPFTAKNLSKFAKFKGDVIFKMYESDGVVEYDTPNYVLFLPRNILNHNLKFGKTTGEKRHTILHFTLSEEKFFELIRSLGGTVKKKHNNPPSSPTLGDLLKL